MTREESDQKMEALIRRGEELGRVNRNLSMFNDSYDTVAAVQVATESTQSSETRQELEDA